MFRRAGFLCAILAMFFIAGGHWTVLQSVAWARMLGDYTQRTGSVVAAVAQTFDGQHPCHLCQEIQTAKAREHQDEGKTSSRAGQDDLRLKALPIKSIPPLPARTVEGIVCLHGAPPLGADRADAPPTPPPRRGKGVA